MSRLILILLLAQCGWGGEAWNRHTIDASEEGADGVRLADVNHDGRLDIATGWEESGIVRAYLHPGTHRVQSNWPSVTAGTVSSPEDAVFADMDADGAIDIISSTEGNERTLYVHYAPQEDYLDSSRWTTTPIAASRGMAQWMFVVPLDVDGKGRLDLIAGSKNSTGAVGVWQYPKDAAKAPVWQHWYHAGWIMSLLPHDLDMDGDIDIVASDRKGQQRGVLWFENTPNPEEWPVHRVGPVDKHEVMFIDIADLDGDGLEDIVSAVRGGPILFFKRLPGETVRWSNHHVKFPDNGFGTGKSVAVGDIDLDGVPDLIFSCENAHGELSGVGLLQHNGDPLDSNWRVTDIGGPEGVKFDLVELVDLDEDGDLDILTCEEADLLGIVWYENPAR